MSGTTTARDARAADVPRQRRGTDGGANRWAVLVVLCVSLLLVALDATVLHVAVPAVTEDLRPGGIELLWIVDAYPLVAASLLILFGTLGDRVGRRRILLLGYALFAVASAVAAFASGPHVLIAARALLGVGGAMIMPATLSILRQVFPDRRERAVAIGIWSAVAAVGAAVGPLLGGFLLEHFWWGSVFLINIPLMAICLPVGRWLLPESTGDHNGPWDVLGAVLAAFGLFGLVFGVKRIGGGEPVLHPVTLGPLLLGAVLMALFLRRQRRRTHPLVDLKTLGRQAFGTSVGCIILAMLALVGLELIATQYLQLVLGFSPLETGVRMVPLTVAAIAAGLLGSRMLQRFGPRAMVAFGFTVTAVAVFSLTLMGQYDRPGLLTLAFVLLGFGLETTLFGSYESMLSEAPAEQAGGAAAIGETSYQLGAGIGIALLGSIMNAAYAPGVSSVPGVPSRAAQSAGHSLGEAYEVAHRIGGAGGRALRQAARDSFVHGMHVTLVASAVLLLFGAVAALRLPRTMECGKLAEDIRDQALGDGERADERLGDARGEPGQPEEAVRGGAAPAHRVEKIPGQQNRGPQSQGTQGPPQQNQGTHGPPQQNQGQHGPGQHGPGAQGRGRQGRGRPAVGAEPSR